MEPPPASAAWSLRRVASIAMLRNADQAAYILVTLAVTPILYRHLGPSDYGIWLLLISQVPLMRLFDPGIHPILLHTVIDRRVHGEPGAAQQTVADGLRLGVAICGGVSAALLLGGGPALHAIGIDIGHEHQRVLLLAPVTLFVAGVLGGVPDAVLFGLNRFAPTISAGILANVLNGAATLLLVLAGFGLLAVALCAIATQALLLFFKFAIAHVLAPELPISLRRGSPHTDAAAPLLKVGAWSTLVAASWVVGYSTDNLVVGSMLSLTSLGAYAVSQRIPNALRTTLQATFGVMFPYAAELHSRDLKPQLRRAIVSGTKAATFVSILVMVGLWDLGPQLLELWVGHVPNGAFLIRLGLLANVMFAVRVIPDNVLYAAGALKYLAIVVATSAVANIALSIALTAWLGASGPLLGTIITGGASVVVLARRIATIAGLLTREYVLESIVYPIVAAIPAVFVLVAAHAARLDRGIAVAGVAFMAGTVYSAGAAAVAMSASERELLRRRVSPMLSRR